MQLNQRHRRVRGLPKLSDTTRSLTDSISKTSNPLPGPYFRVGDMISDYIAVDNIVDAVVFCNRETMVVNSVAAVKEFFLREIDCCIRYDIRVESYGLVVLNAPHLVRIASQVRTSIYLILRAYHHAKVNGQTLFETIRRDELSASAIEVACWIDECVRLEHGQDSSYATAAKDILINLTLNPALQEFFYPANSNLPHFEI